MCWQLRRAEVFDGTRLTSDGLRTTHGGKGALLTFKCATPSSQLGPLSLPLPSSSMTPTALYSAHVMLYVCMRVCLHTYTTFGAVSNDLNGNTNKTLYYVLSHLRNLLNARC
jgi:hypothetical protein